MSSRLIQPSEHSFTLTMKPMENGTRLGDCKVSIEAYVYTNRKVLIDSSYIHKIDDDSLGINIVMEDAIKIGKGVIRFLVNLGIPDSSFPDGYRNQYYEVML